MTYDIPFVFRKLQLLHNILVALQKLGGGEAQGQAFATYLFFDQMGHRMDGGVDGAGAKIQALGESSILSHGHGTLNKLGYALAAIGGNGNNGDGQLLF